MTDPDWVPTRALRRAVGMTCALLVLAAALNRPELVILAAPFVLGTGWSLARRPAELPVVRLELPHDTTSEGGTVRATLAVENPDRRALDLVVVSVRHSRWLRSLDGTREHAVPVPGLSGVEQVLTDRAVRWGRRHLGPVRARGYAGGGLLVGRTVQGGSVPVRIYPVTGPFHADDAMPRAAGVVGAHRTRRPGDGGELAGVRPYQPGDRLRRIDWRVSLRTRELHVAHTYAERDADVVLMLDVLHDAGMSGGLLGPASVLDVTVRATAGIAEHYLSRGDRVSALEYGPSGRHLRPATGRRHYRALLEWLLEVRAWPDGLTSDDRLMSPRLLPRNALVVMMTPLLEDRSAAMLARLARSGRSVLAVDTLRPDVRPGVADRVPGPAGGPGPWDEVGFRLWRVERENTVGVLREAGVPVVPWAGAGSLDQVLRDVTRMAAAPRAVRR